MQAIQDAIAAIDNLLTLYPWMSVFFGGLIGTILAQLWSGIQGWRKEIRGNRTMRKLLRLEIDHNLRELVGAKDNLLAVQVDMQRETVRYSKLFIPDIQTGVFDGLITKLAGALSTEEIEKVFQFYTYAKTVYKDLLENCENIPRENKNRIPVYVDGIESACEIGNPLNTRASLYSFLLKGKPHKNQRTIDNPPK